VLWLVELASAANIAAVRRLFSITTAVWSASAGLSGDYAHAAGLAKWSPMPRFAVGMYGDRLSRAGIGAAAASLWRRSHLRWFSPGGVGAKCAARNGLAMQALEWLRFQP